MSVLGFPSPPCYLKFNSHGHEHNYKSKLIPLFNSYPGASINNAIKFNAKHRSHQLGELKWTDRTATKASNNSQQETQGSSEWIKWVIGVILSVILPAYGSRDKWAPLLGLKKNVDKALETVESVAETVEEVAEGVEKIADEISDKLPDDTKLRNTVEFVEEKAKEAVKEAKLAEDLVDKIQEAEKGLENEVTKSNVDQAKSDKPKQS